MATHLIGYDLHPKNGETYTELIEAIKALGIGQSWHCLDSTWINKSNLTSEQVCNALWKHMKADDQLFVVQIENRPAAWNGFGQVCSDWLKKNL